MHGVALREQGAPVAKAHHLGQRQGNANRGFHRLLEPHRDFTAGTINGVLRQRDGGSAFNQIKQLSLQLAHVRTFVSDQSERG